MDWVNSFFAPIIKIIFVGGFILGFNFFLMKGMYNAWTKSWKFTWKYQIKKEKYPETTLKWVFDCIDAGIGWYDAKRLMLVNQTPTEMINETLWIYDRVIIELNKQKGGNNGRKIERCNKQNENSTKLPSI